MCAEVNRRSSHPFSDSDSDSGSDTGQSLDHRHERFSDSIFKAYIECHASSSSPTSTDLSKIESFVASSSSGVSSCLICLERIKRTDPAWSCTSLCFTPFHLVCIQSWARQCLDLQAARAATHSSGKQVDSGTWHCPKCRSSFLRSQLPRRYLCFCGKLEDPPADNPWILPHSCGEICERPLSNNCGHFCLLLCHPGPCPPCPKLVKARCFCGGVEEARRCGHKQFSCSRLCDRFLECRIHKCREICHQGTCPPCRERAVYSCRCRKVEEERDCCDSEFGCNNPCKKLLSCGKHACEKGCHSGKCGDCPFQGKRTCPCGNSVYEGLPCDITVPLCGATCDKTLRCGFHGCPERCHWGECVQTCRIVVNKSCRCGGLKKQVPCYQELACERRCQKIRDCGRHACRRRCCDGNCPPCSEICGRKLRCKNHKCPAPCHWGPCAPCPVMVTIACACGETCFEVPCGSEKDKRPPKCRKICLITPLCRHRAISKPHKCHYGACPPCRLCCDAEYPCGHRCKLRCHDSRPPPNEEFTLKQKKKKINRQNECSPGSPCPPCPELVVRPCVGQHLGAEKLMVCSSQVEFSCNNLCGNPLPCGNHYCTKTCHPLGILQPSSGLCLQSESCEECDLPCEKESKLSCSHRCPLPCHPGDCPPCTLLIKRACHCGSMVHAFECNYYNTLTQQEQLKVRSCGGPCHRKLPNCTHLCPEICHPGQCRLPENCSKKVVVRCECQRLKREWVCRDVQAAYRKRGYDPKEMPKSQFGHGLLSCDSDCKKKVAVVDSAAEVNQRRVKDPEEKELALGREKRSLKRRRRREKFTEGNQVSPIEKVVVILKRMLVFGVLVATLLLAVYCGYKGLLRVSDWMNELEEQQQRRRRHTRI